MAKERADGETAQHYNIVKYITAFPQRVEAFEDIQRKSTADGTDGAILKLVKDNFTR